uniref:Apple domain-containing protein n=2 Tax=Wuchereria bancrofti TaxID=6293 RepID=A0A1I8ET18_WUCBA
MAITVAFTVSFINLPLLLLLLSAVALKPCFEQHIGQQLSDLSPYHSEWRMKTPEECLLFCALSSSRCRSTVHDTFQHICHYFLDDGQQHSQIARGMVYFRVVEKKCLDQFLNGFNLTFLGSEFAISETSPSTPKYDTDIGFIELQRPAVAHANPLIHVPPGGRAITPTPYFDYFDNQQKLKNNEKFDESNLTIATSIMTTSDKTNLPANGITVNTFTSSPTALSKVLSRDYQIYDESAHMIPASKFFMSTFPTLLSTHKENLLNLTSRRTKALEQSSHETHSSDDALSFTENIRKLPTLSANFGKDRQEDGVDLNKLLKMVTEDIRRSPIKTSVIDMEKLDEKSNEMMTFLNAKKSILDKLIPISTAKSISMTFSKQNSRTERLLPTAAICGSDEREVWLTVVNAVLERNRLQKETSAASYNSCKIKCNLITVSGRECTSFTYDEVKRHCVTHTNNNAVVASLAFSPSPESDFNIQTAVKFCYPESLILLEECSEFTAFLDYAIDIEPWEIFDGIPRGHQGLHACIELCVLAPHFHCKSAAFVVNLGKCLLYDENSLSSPEHFQEHQEYGLIYFENGCKQFDKTQSWINFSQHFIKS